MSDFKERIEYIKDGDIFIGRSVNHSVCTQASSLEELEKRMMFMINSSLDFHIETMKQEQPIELKEISKEDWEAEYAEWMKTSKWINIADALYDTLRDLVGDKWTNEAVEKYETNTTRIDVKDRLK